MAVAFVMVMLPLQTPSTKSTSGWRNGAAAPPLDSRRRACCNRTPDFRQRPLQLSLRQRVSGGLQLAMVANSK
ncbi:MAG: hypothetical protein R3C26_21210 [Calditrichia bacterium]